MSVISAATFRDHLDQWGVDYVEHTRWDRCLDREVPWSQHEARRYRDCARRGWDAHGIAIHHSGGPTAWWYVWDGRLLDNIPGPLYTTIIYEDGTAHLTGFKITNNVGRCDRTVRDRVLRGDMPTSGEINPGDDDYFAANSEFYGISYRGKVPSTAQRRTARLICAAICTAHGNDWDGGSIAGHRELTGRKPDPAGEGMGDFRRDVNRLLEVGRFELASNVVSIGGIDFGGSGADFGEIEEADMPLSDDDVEKIARAVWRRDGIIGSPHWADDDNPHWIGARYLQEIRERVTHAAVRRAVIDALEQQRPFRSQQLGEDHSPKTARWLIEWGGMPGFENRQAARRTEAKVEAIAEVVREIAGVDQDAFAQKVAAAVERLDAEAVADELEVSVKDDGE